MPPKVSVALVSQVARARDKDWNLSQIESALAQAWAVPAHLYVFPEASIVGGLWRGGEQDYARLAEQVPDGQSCERVSCLARRYGTTVCAGLIEQSGGLYFVTHFLCGPNGYIGKQRKVFPTDLRRPGFFAAGGEVVPLSVFETRCVILACADLFMPESTVLAGLVGSGLVLSPTNSFKEKHADRVKAVVRTRSMDMGAHVAVAFGHDPRVRRERHLAGIAAGAGGKLLAFDTREPGESSTVRYELTPQVPKVRWGGFEERAKILSKNLEGLTWSEES